jgi:hypothetical protein
MRAIRRDGAATVYVTALAAGPKRVRELTRTVRLMDDGRHQRADPPPDDMRVACELVAVLERRATIRSPGDFPHAGIALDALDPKPRAKCAAAKVGDELLDFSGRRVGLVIEQRPSA